MLLQWQGSKFMVSFCFVSSPELWLLGYDEGVFAWYKPGPRFTAEQEKGSVPWPCCRHFTGETARCQSAEA